MLSLDSFQVGVVLSWHVARHKEKTHLQLVRPLTQTMITIVSNENGLEQFR